MRRQGTGALLLAALLVLSACAVSGEPEPEPEWESYTSQGSFLPGFQSRKPELGGAGPAEAFTLAWQLRSQTLPIKPAAEGTWDPVKTRPSLLFESLYPPWTGPYRPSPSSNCRGYSWDSKEDGGCGVHPGTSGRHVRRSRTGVRLTAAGT